MGGVVSSVRRGAKLPDLEEYQERSSFSYDAFLRAPQERVWRALTDPAALDCWETTHADVDLRAGGRFHFAFEYGPPDDGVFLNVDPPRRLVQWWQSRLTRALTLDLVSVLTLSPTDQGTSLWLRMSGYGTDDDQRWLLETMRDGWRNDLAVLKMFVETGRDARPTIWPGVSLNLRCITLPRERAAALGVPSGAYVLEVYPDGPGASAGLRPSDVIVAFAGVPVHTRGDLVAVLERCRSDERWPVEYFRDGRRRFGEVVLTSQLPSAAPDRVAVAATNAE